jgi:IS5 family transposase
MPKKSVLHRTISVIRAETWEAINRILLASARQEKVETGKVVRFDSTVDKHRRAGFDCRDSHRFGLGEPIPSDGQQPRDGAGRWRAGQALRRRPCRLSGVAQPIR